LVLNLYFCVIRYVKILITAMLYSYTIGYKISYTVIADFMYRTYLDDFFANNFYYLWTSFLYLPILFFTLYLINMLSSLSSLQNFRLYSTLLTSLLLFYINTFNFWGFNSVHYFNIINSEEINTLLFNTINKYHPFLFYLSSSTLYIIFTTITSLGVPSTDYKFSVQLVLLTTFSASLKQIFIAIVTLYLGSWWAVQEGSWGGWWNWDPSEVFGLLFLIPTVLYLHLGVTSSDVTYTRRFFTYYLLAISLLYFLIQLNFNLVSHNFNTNSTSNMHLFILLTGAFSFLTARLSIFFRNSIGATLVVNLYFTLKNVTWSGVYYRVIFLLLISYLTFLILAASFSTLINEFLFIISGLDLSTVSNNIMSFEFIIYSLMITSTWSWSSIYLIVLVSATYHNLPYYFLLFVFSMCYRSIVFIMHYYLNVFLLVSLLSVGWYITVWDCEGYSIETDSWLNTQLYLLDTLSLLSGGLDKLSLCIQNLAINHRPSSFYILSSTPESTTFHLNSFDMLTTQSLINSSFFFKSVIKVFDFTLMVLLSLVYMLLYFTYTLFSKKKLIIF